MDSSLANDPCDCNDDCRCRRYVNARNYAFIDTVEEMPQNNYGLCANCEKELDKNYIPCNTYLDGIPYKSRFCSKACIQTAVYPSVPIPHRIEQHICVQGNPNCYCKFNEP